MSRRTKTISFVAALVALVPTTALVASAASLGPLSSRSLGAWTRTGGTGAPTVGAWDNFSRTGDLNGQASGGAGPAWQAVAGTWTATAGGTARETSGDDAALVVDCGRTDVTASVVLPVANGQFAAGLALKSVASGFIAVEWAKQAGGGHVTVDIVSGSNRTPLGSTPQLGNIPPLTLSATYTAGVVTVRLNGNVVLTSRPLTPAELTTFAPSTRFGLHASGDTKTTFDDFRCEY